MSTIRILPVMDSSQEPVWRLPPRWAITVLRPKETVYKFETFCPNVKVTIQSAWIR